MIWDGAYAFVDGPDGISLQKRSKLHVRLSNDGCCQDQRVVPLGLFHLRRWHRWCMLQLAIAGLK